MARKNKASLIMNKVTPMFNPLWTAKVWSPKKLPSEIISLNHKDMESIKQVKAANRKKLLFEKLCIVYTPAVVRLSKDIQLLRGHGEGETKWKGCAWKLLLLMLVIIKMSLFRKITIWFIVVKFYLSHRNKRNFSSDTDSIEVGIELCNIPQSSEHCPKNVPSLFIRADAWLSLPGYASALIPKAGIE